MWNVQGLDESTGRAVEIPVHSEAIVPVKKWSSNHSCRIKLDFLPKVAKAANFFGIKLLYRSALRTIATEANRGRILQWSKDLKSLGRTEKVDLLDSILAEQPVRELFECLTNAENDGPIISLDENELDRYAIRFQANDAAWMLLQSACSPPYQAKGVRFCGHWRYCYTLLYGIREYDQTLTIHDLYGEERKGTIKDVCAATYSRFGSADYLLSITGGKVKTLQVTNFPDVSKIRNISMPNSTFVAASSKSIVVLNSGDSQSRWEYESSDTFDGCIERESTYDCVSEIAISPDDTFEIMDDFRDKEVTIRFRDGSGHPLKNVHTDGYSSPLSFDISPDSEAFAVWSDAHTWFGRIDRLANGNASSDLSVSCVEQYARPLLEHDYMTCGKYSPDGRYISLLSWTGRILVFEKQDNNGNPLLVNDDLLNRDFGRLAFKDKEITCVDWSPEGELLLIGFTLGAILFPIGQAIRKAKQSAEANILTCS